MQKLVYDVENECVLVHLFKGGDGLREKVRGREERERKGIKKGTFICYRV